MTNQVVWVTCQSKNKVTDLLASSLETRAPACSLSKLDNYLSNITRLRSIDGQALKNRLGG
jgi:hypothetical protein